MIKNALTSFNKPILEIIKSRRSVRSYKEDKLDLGIKDKITTYAENILGPFESRVRFKFLDNSLESDYGKMGTYGIIKGAQDFIAVIVDDKENNLEQVGYTLEKLVLYATSLGLGTCWMGGTFKRSDFQKLVGLEANEIMPIVTPVGYPREQGSYIEHFMRYAARSNQRKEMRELFFQDDFKTPIEVEEGIYLDALEAVRLAPSASNKQPWRILRKKDKYHFFLKSNVGYSEALGFDIQRIDMGIAMCHFEMMLNESGIKGQWVKEEFIEPSADNNMLYIISWFEE